MDQRPLTHLQQSERALIAGVLPGADGFDATLLRLLEMGLVPGVEVALVRSAPLGDPIEILIKGTRLCLRRKDAACILVQALPAAPSGAPSGAQSGEQSGARS